MKRCIIALLALCVAASPLLANNPRQGQTAIRRFSLFEADGSMVSTGTPLVLVSKDGGAEVASTNTATLISDGLWKVTLTGAETTANHVGLRITHADALQVDREFNPWDGTTGVSIGTGGIVDGSFAIAPGLSGGLLKVGANDGSSFTALTITGDFSVGSFEPAAMTINSVSNVAQTGNSFTLLGTPTGANVSADLVTMKALVDDLEGRLTATRAGYFDTIFGALPDAGDQMAGEDAVVAVGTLTDVDQEPVPDNRVFPLVYTDDEGLVAEKPKSIVVGVSANTYAVDFKNDMPVNGRITNVGTPTIVTGAVGGITFANLGRDKSQAKFRPTGVTAGTYVCRVEVTKYGGAIAAGTFTFIVAP